MGGLIMVSNVTTKRDLGLQKGAGHVWSLNRGSTEGESDGGGSVRDCVVDHIMSLKR